MVTHKLRTQHMLSRWMFHTSDGTTTPVRLDRFNRGSSRALFLRQVARALHSSWHELKSLHDELVLLASREVLLVVLLIEVHVVNRLVYFSNQELDDYILVYR